MANRTSICVGGPLDGQTHTADSDFFNALADYSTPVGRAKGPVPQITSAFSYRWLQIAPNVLPVWVPLGQSIGETVGLLIGGYQGVGDG